MDKKYQQEFRSLYGFDPSHPDVADIIKAVKVAKFKKGEIILRPYDETDYIYRVRKGLIKIFSIRADGQENIIEIYGHGDIFPLGWIVNASLQDVFFTALTDCEVVLAPKKIVLRQLKSSATVSFAILCKTIDQFRLYSSRVVNLELKFARERLAYRLLLFAARFGEEKKDGSIHLPRISHYDLAAMVNATRESASREMSRFERLGIIKYTPSKIVITSCRNLRKELGKDVSIMFFDSK